MEKVGWTTGGVKYGSPLPTGGGAWGQEKRGRFKQVDGRPVWNQCREASNFSAWTDPLCPCQLIRSALDSGTSSGKVWCHVQPSSPAAMPLDKQQHRIKHAAITYRSKATSLRASIPIFDDAIHSPPILRENISKLKIYQQKLIIPTVEYFLLEN